jgi:hypothetical protein
MEAAAMADTVGANAKTQAQRALASSPIYDLRDLRVDFVNGSLLLSGRVETFYHKQLAQEVVRSVVDGVPVINDVAVEYVACV